MARLQDGGGHPPRAPRRRAGAVPAVRGGPPRYAGAGPARGRDPPCGGPRAPPSEHDPPGQAAAHRAVMDCPAPHPSGSGRPGTVPLRGVPPRFSAGLAHRSGAAARARGARRRRAGRAGRPRAVRLVPAPGRVRAGPLRAGPAVDDRVPGAGVAGSSRGRALFEVRDGRLVTVEIDACEVPPELARAALLAGLNEDLTTFRHNLSVHLAMLTSFAL